MVARAEVNATSVIAFVINSRLDHDRAENEVFGLNPIPYCFVTCLGYLRYFVWLLSALRV